MMDAQSDNTNPYDTLGVPKTASSSDIKHAYRRKSSAAHPDREGGSDAAMRQINRAYALLSDESRRQHYDTTGQEQRTPIQQTARDNLAQLVPKVLEEYANNAEFDLVFKLREIVTHSRTDLAAKITTQRRKLDKIERVLKKRLKPNTNADPMLVWIIEQQVTQERARLADMEGGHEVGGVMLGMLAGYGWEAEPKAPVVQNNSLDMYGGGYTAGIWSR
jgi:curved DNA-binding protein CbpA